MAQPDIDLHSDREKSLTDYLYVIVKRRRMVCLNVLVVAVITAIISLLVPKWYESRASLLPDETMGLDSGLMSYVQSNFPLFQLTGASTPAQGTVSILKSRRVAEQVVRANELTEVYGAETMDAAVAALREHRDILIDENGTVVLIVEARDPLRAAAMARSHLTALEEYNAATRATTGRRIREFVEERLEETDSRLRAAEDSLTAFQSRNATFEISEQARAMISTMAEVEAKLTMAQIQLGVIRAYASESHPEVRRLRAEIEEYRSQIRKLTAGGDEPGSGGPLGTPLTELPDLAVRYARLMRTTEALGQVYLYLLQEYESARIQEARDTPTVQILDEPEPPELRVRPKRKVMVVIGAMIGLLAGVVAALGIEYYESSDPDEPHRRNIDAVVRMLRSDLRRLTPGGGRGT
ncbi:MAG: hypothetical protein GF405_05690 [Candidatus Eisenbacteria bacterium]|nr:hypothetical protein [Candidatus Eisenbacteria bacterium]